MEALSRWRGGQLSRQRTKLERDNEASIGRMAGWKGEKEKSEEGGKGTI